MKIGAFAAAIALALVWGTPATGETSWSGDPATAIETYSSIGSPIEPHGVAFSPLSTGTLRRLPRANRVFLARTPREAAGWNRFLIASERRALARVDYRRRAVLAVVHRRPDVAISEVTASHDTLWLSIRIKEPQSSCPRAPYPCRISLGSGGFAAVALPRAEVDAVASLYVRAEEYVTATG